MVVEINTNCVEMCLFGRLIINTPFPNLFSATICHMKMKPYLENLHLMKENDKNHGKNT